PSTAWTPSTCSNSCSPPGRGYLTRLPQAEYVPEDVQDYFVRELRTVSQPTLNIKQIAATRVLVPPSNLLRKFGVQAAAASRLKALHRAHLAELDALFASLQDKAFRGEL
ncbi:hypothetical protein, partial [Micromonospora sp. NPDC050695]|uniref:restriction endonuclease subunit S n=1 Tax=Micromonospora sp. NPDC050695 TaxID=3154938 RepID=UPI0033D0EC91